MWKLAASLFLRVHNLNYITVLINLSNSLKERLSVGLHNKQKFQSTRSRKKLMNIFHMSNISILTSIDYPVTSDRFVPGP